MKRDYMVFSPIKSLPRAPKNGYWPKMTPKLAFKGSEKSQLPSVESISANQPRYLVDAGKKKSAFDCENVIEGVTKWKAIVWKSPYII